MNILSIHQNDCTGCMVCVNVCPVNCITVIVNEEGFSYPQIVIEKCLNCGKCYKICPTISVTSQNPPFKVYAAQGKKLVQVRKSSSGGIAYLLAENVIKNGGVVYGCVYDESLRVIHKRAETKEELLQQLGSKYVQSDFSEVYQSLLEDCKKGRRVAVFATPCQIAAVRNYLGKDYNNLLLVDLICHGVPSPKLFQSYLEWKAKNMGNSPIIKYNFRDKSSGWGTVYRASTATATTTVTATEDPYYSAFIYGETYRESCYRCCFANANRVGDITIGDYWGIKKQHPEICTNYTDGISAVLITTDKGEIAFTEIKSQLKYVVSSFEKVAVGNSNLYQPATRPELRNIFYKRINEAGFEWANHQMYQNQRFYINYIKQRVPKGVKVAIKKILGRS